MEVMELGRLMDLINSLDFTLDTKRKRHIVGGILLSISALFGGLAITTMTLKEIEEINEDIDKEDIEDE